MAPERVPGQALPFLESVNTFWGLISGVVLGLWLSFKIIWNISGYFRGVNDKLARVEADIDALRENVANTRQCPYPQKVCHLDS